MKKTVKILLFLPIILFILYLIFLTYVKNSINVTNIKNKMNELVSTKIQEYKNHQLFLKKDIKFAIRGKINLSVFPNIKMIINDINLNDIQFRGNLFSANIKKLEFKLSLMDFLRKKININDVIVNSVMLTIQQNRLADFYIKKEIVKKIVKLEENEVIGVKTKIKNLLVNNKNNNIEDGYKEVEVIEDTKIDLDNSEIEYMFLNLVKLIKVDSFTIKDNLKIDISNMKINYIRNGSVQKEINDIRGELNIGKKIKFESSFNLNNVNGNLNISYSIDNKKNNINLKLTNSMNDILSIDYIGDNLIMTDYDKIVASIDIDAKIKNFNDFSQWILFADSKYYYLIDYKKNINLKTTLDKNISSYNFKTFILNSDDIDITGNFKKDKFFNLEADINKLNLDNIIINLGKDKPLLDYKEINIFKVNNINELIELISKNSENKSKVENNGNIKINIKELTKNNKIIKNSTFDCTVENGNYKINNFKVNLNGMNIDIYNQEKIGNLFVNSLKIEGQDFTDITNFLSLPNFFEIKDFTMESKIFVNNNVLYLTEYTVKSQNKEIINGSLEYSFDKNKNYTALIMNIDELSIKMENKKNNTIKEELLWLNNFTKNVFIELAINNLKYNNLQNINIKTKLNFSPGYLNLYDITNIDFEHIKGIKGKINLDIRNKNSMINADLLISNIEKNINLVNHIFDIEKYKSILLREKIDENNRANYWVNMLFSIPQFDSIGGNISLKIADFKFNELPIKNIETIATIDNGVININNLKFDGLGGSTNIKANIDIKNTRKINITLNETIYSINDLAKLFIGNNKLVGDLTGNIGLAGIISGVGFNSNVFNSSLNMQIKFIGNDFFIKKIGLKDLKDKLLLIYTDKNIRDNFNAREIITNNTGTIFKDFSGNFIMNAGISRLSAKAEGDGISSKIDLKVDSSTNITTINMVNTSLVMTKAGNENIPLYINISFTEDFANKANLIINTNQVDEYVEQVRKLSNPNKNRKINNKNKKTINN